MAVDTAGALGGAVANDGILKEQVQDSSEEHEEATVSTRDKVSHSPTYTRQ
jgi:hypothetical protein